MQLGRLCRLVCQVARSLQDARVGGLEEVRHGAHVAAHVALPCLARGVRVRRALVEDLQKHHTTPSAARQSVSWTMLVYESYHCSVYMQAFLCRAFKRSSSKTVCK